MNDVRQRPSGVKRGALLAGLLLAVALLAGCGDTQAGPPPAGPGRGPAGATRTPPPSAPRTPVPPSPTRAATATTAPSDVYTVQRGDTLNAIAARFGVTVACLVTANQIANPDLIRPGQPITIPPCDARTQPIRGALQPTRPAAEQAPAAVPQPTAPPPAANCDPSYPDVCIPPPPPDLDCGEILYRRFRALPPDPHRFDGDRDGIGCER